jgi:acid phosphatase
MASSPVSSRSGGRATIVVVALLVAGCGSSGRGAASGSSTTGSRTAVTAVAGSPSSTGPSGRWRPAHIVVVIEENKAASQVLASPDAPYIDQLSRDGATLGQSYAVAHPSEPNYLALFSGSTHGLSDDSCPPHGAPYADANLATALTATGASFVSYSESLPAPGSLACSAGPYARKHNPVTDFSNVPTSANRPFTAFPQDYSHLPTVAFVVPNLDHDMHDGTIAQGDGWLRDNLGAYVRWAPSHDSLLVLTWDEDDSSAGNHIATVIAGAHVRAGRYDERVDHYGVLATISRLVGAQPPGQAATAVAVRDIWTSATGT